MNILHLQDCTVDLTRRSVTMGEQTRVITELEVTLLRYLAENPERTITRQELLENVWGYNPNTVSRTVDQSIKQLRKKLGETSSKPKHIFSVYGKGYRFSLPEQPAPAAPALAASNMGTTHDPLIGRDKEFLQLEAHFTGEGRLLTLLAAGGMGKTTLARAFGVRSRKTDRYPGGVWFCDLAASNNTHDILRAIGNVLGLRYEAASSVQALSDQVGNALYACGRCLLILDNFEQIVASAEYTVKRWYELAKEAHFLITTRQLLAIPEESILEIRPLSSSDSVELFVKRARLLRNSYDPTPEERDVIEVLVKRLDGIPLAIQMAAGRMRMLSPNQINQRLSDRFRLLRMGKQISGERQGTLRATIDWSWNLLEEAERATLQQCSVFRGGFTMEAAEAVVKLDDPSMWLEDVLQSLVDKSMLILIDNDSPDPSGRIGAFDSIRYYALEKLTDAGRQGPTEFRHSAYYLSWLEKMSKDDSPENMNLLLNEVDNLQEVWMRTRHLGPDAAFSIVQRLTRLYEHQGWHHHLLQLVDPLLEDGMLDADSEAQLRGIRGRLLYWMDRTEDAAAEFRTAIDTAECPKRRDSLTSNLCNVLVRLQRYDEAEALIEQLLERNTSDRGRGYLWSVRGSLCFSTHRLGQAVSCLTHSARHYDEAGEVGGLSVALTGLSSCQILLGDLDAAAENAFRALPLTDAMHNKRHGSICRANLVSIHLRRLEPSKASPLLSESLSLAMLLKDLRQERSVQTLAAVHAFILNDLERMGVVVQRLRAIAELLPSSPHGVTSALEAVCLLHHGDQERASVAWAESCRALSGSLHISDEDWAALWEMHLAAHQLCELEREGAPSAQVREVRFKLRRWIRRHEVPRAPVEQVVFRGTMEHHLHVVMLEHIVEQSTRSSG